MSRTLELLNASGKHVIRFRFKAIIIIMYTQVSVYTVRVNILYMQTRCIYCIYVRGK